MATTGKPIHRIINLIDPESQRLFGTDLEQVRQILLRDDPDGLFQVGGSYALLAREGDTVRMARSLDRPMRFFLAKAAAGPLLVIADRIDQIQRCLVEEGFGEQFHPSYTRMVPAHHITTIRLVGCPDPNPIYRRFVTPEIRPLPADLDSIGKTYVEALCHSIDQWLDTLPVDEPIGMLFSGGVDSGSVLVCLYKRLLGRGQSASRLKAFTLSVDSDGTDAKNARRFLSRLDLEFLGETIEVGSSRVDPLAAVDLIEDYKVRDVECAAVSLALLEAIRARYPEWRVLIDGDGGDENFKDYPIEENPELTIHSVVGNPMLYQEGWGVDRIKHSLTYSGGLSRGCVRTFAPLQHHGFVGFSPFTQPRLVQLAASIPFAELAGDSHEALYELKGEIMRRGIQQVLGCELPVFGKKRFQEGAISPSAFRTRFAFPPERYRNHYLDAYRR